ncbi:MULTISPECIES: hypothetical protein [Gammaproteobacteria]|uniref:hypothetical protein n=1 Tax=Gammaproteobacteria TaxID=1236 RepID=UPI001126E433|nr:hypothetical protein [Pseudomonas sp. Hp2]
MTVLAWLALSCYLLTFLLVALFALAYLKRTEFMPYHRAAVARDWRDIDEPMRLLLLALIKVVGAAWLAAAVAGFLSLYLLFSRPGVAWQLWLFQGFCLLTVVPPIAVAAHLRRRTKAPTPLSLGAVMVLFSLAGFVLSLSSGHFRTG